MAQAVTEFLAGPPGLTPAGGRPRGARASVE